MFRICFRRRCSATVAQHYGVEDFGAMIASKLGPFQSLPFPGGWTIGLIMLINLTAAHALKFKVRARGLKLAAGIVLIVLGMLLTYAVVVTGNMQMGVEFGENTLLSQRQYLAAHAGADWRSPGLRLWRRPRCQRPWGHCLAGFWEVSACCC